MSVTACLGCDVRPRPAVRDHCHAHGHQRGILCSRCNTLMAWLDRGMIPRTVSSADLARLISHAARCPDCPPVDPLRLLPAKPFGNPIPPIRKRKHTEPVHMNIDKNLAHEVRAYADSHGVSLAAAVSVLLRQALKGEQS